MKRDFLKLYNIELQHVREMAGEFAREYPKIAGRLALDPDGKEICPDPFVERLLEGFAYLTARVHLKLDAEFPRLSQGLLETVYPQYLAPVPSMAVVQFEPNFKDKALAEGFSIARGTSLRNLAGRSEHTPCTYRTAHEVKLWPVELRGADYSTRGLAGMELPAGSQFAAALRLEFGATAGLKFSEIALDRLTFFLRGTDELPAAVLEHIFAHAKGVLVRSRDGGSPQWRTLPRKALRLVGLASDESLLPASATTFEGYRLLMEYFAFPQRFLFFEIDGFASHMRELTGQSLEIVIGLGQANPAFEGRIHESVFGLYCTPVINLFEKRADRVALSNRFSEYHVVVDRTRPVDYEVYALRSVTGYGAVSGEEQAFQPFYLARDTERASTAFYTMHRAPRVLTEREKKFGSLSSYPGSEVFLSLVDAESAPYASGLQQLGVTALCTNRHLPIRMSRGDGATEFAVELNGPVQSAWCLAGPTPPRASLAIGEFAWRLISHLSLNYLSLADSANGEGALALRELLRLYVEPSDLSMRKQVEGLSSVHAVPVLRRIAAPGIITFGRGLEITVAFDEDAFAGTGVFLLGLVLEQFFARYVTINSFTETVIRSKQRGEIIRWPVRTGSRQIL